MTQRGDGVFVFDWGDAPSGGQTRQPAQNTAQPRPASGGPQTVNNFVPPGQTGNAPQPAAQPRAPAAAPQAPSVPAPVMPVVGDRIIRFND